MQIINYGELAGELVKYNTFTVDGQLCLGTVVTRNYEECGIPVLADLNHLKWIVNEWEIEHITKIEKDSSDNKCYYKIIFDSFPPKSIICYNRNDIESIPAEDCGTDFLKLLDKDIFDDTTSFILEDNPFPAAVIGLDLRRLRLSDLQKHKIAKEMNKIACCLHSPPKNDSSETLCLMVATEDYSFSFHGLDVNTLDLRLLYISEDIYHHDKVKEYAQMMKNSYNTAYKNVKAKTDLIKELSELIGSVSQ